MIFIFGHHKTIVLLVMALTIAHVTSFTTRQSILAAASARVNRHRFPDDQPILYQFSDLLACTQVVQLGIGGLFQQNTFKIKAYESWHWRSHWFHWGPTRPSSCRSARRWRPSASGAWACWKGKHWHFIIAEILGGKCEQTIKLKYLSYDYQKLLFGRNCAPNNHFEAKL